MIAGYKDSQNYIYASKLVLAKPKFDAGNYEGYQAEIKPLKDAGYEPAITEYDKAQKEIDAIKAKEEADRKAAEAKRVAEEAEYKKAMSAIEGTWKWQNFFGYYMEIKNGKISYGNQTDRSVDHSDESWSENAGTITYNVDTNKYEISFGWASTMTFDGTKIKFFDEYGDPSPFFDEYAIRHKF